MTETVSVDFSDGIAHVRLNRPEKHNALNMALFRDLEETLEVLTRQPGLRAVVLSGEGPSFCAGIDLHSLAAQPDQLQEMHRLLSDTDPNGSNIYQRVCVGWQRLPVPVIAAITGHCYGGGMQIALGCDVRIAAPEAKFSIMEIRWGIIPDMGATVTTRSLLRYDQLLDLTLSGRVVEAPEALTLGLITRTAPDALSAAQEMASAIANKSPDAVRAAKSLYLSTRQLSDVDALALEAKVQTGLIGQPNQMEAVMAGMAKREPRFTD
ncbi:MAG: crotonase/enoyl-CoA hydratase family protein [Pseudomonadota bacterium]